MRLGQLFAAAGPHISLKAEALFTVGPVTVTNSLVYGLVVAAVLAIGAWWLGRRLSILPSGGVVQIFELVMEFMIDTLEGVFGSRRMAYRFAPIFGTYFIFIVLNNLSGLMPFIGSSVALGDTPVFRPFTADLNGTIAISLVAVLTVQYLSIQQSGVRGHLRHYFTDKPLNPINMLVGLFEVFGELTRVASLSMRLFLNTAVGEILIAVMAFVGGYGSSLTILPIALFEILVALVQAYIFAVLAATYLGLAIHHHEDDHSTDLQSAQSDPEKLIAKELAG